MNVLILIENPPDSLVAEVDAALAGHGVEAELRTASDRAALVSALEHLSDVWDGLILTPQPDPGNGGLRALLAELDCFSVEVQPDNIASKGMATAGTDAQLFGLGTGGYALALELLSERAMR